jgi:hypothetical protein
LNQQGVERIGWAQAVLIADRVPAKLLGLNITTFIFYEIKGKSLKFITFNKMPALQYSCFGSTYCFQWLLGFARGRETPVRRPVDF